MFRARCVVGLLIVYVMLLDAGELAAAFEFPIHMADTLGRQVTIKTTLLLFRCRNVIEQGKGGHHIVAEEMLLWGWRGTPQQKEFLTHAQAKALLVDAQDVLLDGFCFGPASVGQVASMSCSVSR